MTIRTILVPVRGDGKGEQLLDHARALAEPFNAHIDVVHCRPRPEDMIPFGVAVPRAWREQITASASGIADTEEEKVRERFDAYVQSRALTLCNTRPAPHDAVSISWSEETGKQAAIVARLGKLASVVAVAKLDRESNLGFNTLESALLETGRPVLLCPPAAPKSVGKHVAVAWNGSTEVARAIAVSMPIIANAERVSILAEEKADDKDLSAADLQVFLRDHGVEATPEAIPSSGGRIGQRILAAAKAAGADVLVMGAYGRSRGREMILGGATQWIIEETDLPVLLTH